MSISLSSKDKKGLQNAIITVLNKAFANVNAQTEPQLVANLVYYLPPAVNKLPFLNGINSIKSSGVYIHQQPQVQYSNMPDKSHNSVELGDLLLIHTEKQNGVAINKKGLLLQAKKFSIMPVDPDNDNQLELYLHWPQFEYARSRKVLNGQMRQITGIDLHNCSRFLLIHKNSPPCHRCSLLAKANTPKLTHGYCLIAELTEFILGNRGKSYISPPPSGSQDWDKVMEDLTTITAVKTSAYMSNAAGKKSTPRGQCLCFMAGDFSFGNSIFLDFEDFPKTENHLEDAPPRVPENHEINFDDEEAGISIIEFVVDTDMNSKESNKNT